MASLSEIRAAIKATIENNISGLNVYVKVPAAIVAPAVAIYPAPMEYPFTYGNSSSRWEFDLIVAVPGDDELAQDPLDELIDAVGERSIMQALLANQGLGRSDCSLCNPLAMSNYGAKITFGETTYVGAQLRIGVVTTHR